MASNKSGIFVWEKMKSGIIRVMHSFCSFKSEINKVELLGLFQLYCLNSRIKRWQYWHILAFYSLILTIKLT